jgi:hypothetical protein
MRLKTSNLAALLLVFLCGVALLLLFKRSRQWVKRRFKELDFLEQYFPLLFTRWQAAIWGGSVLAVAFGWRFITSDWPYPVKLTACVVALFFAGYYVWRADHLRLQQKMSIPRVLSQSWPIDNANLATLFYLEIVNTSEGLTIYDVHVQLEEIVPRVLGIDWLPVALVHKHDNPIRAQDYKLSFDLHPGEPKHIDFIAGVVGGDHFDIYHVVRDADRRIPSTTRHRLRVMVTARDMPALFVWFSVWMDENGTPKCQIE